MLLICRPNDTTQVTYQTKHAPVFTPTFCCLPAGTNRTCYEPLYSLDMKGHFFVLGLVKFSFLHELWQCVHSSWSCLYTVWLYSITNVAFKSFFSSLTVAMFLFKLLFCVKLEQQMLHLKGFLYSWTVVMCPFKSHLKGFIPSWTEAMCTFQVLVCCKVITSQILQ